MTAATKKIYAQIWRSIDELDWALDGLRLVEENALQMAERASKGESPDVIHLRGLAGAFVCLRQQACDARDVLGPVVKQLQDGGDR